MIINRSFKDFKFRHRSKKNQIIYTSKKVNSDDEIINLIDNFLEEKNSFIFESVEKGKIKGRYTIFGKNPDKIWEFNNQKAYLITENKKIILKDKPKILIEKIIENFKFDTPKNLPKICSLISGYFSYDSIRYIEKIPNTCKDDLYLPDVRLMRPRTLIIHDNLKKEIFYINNIFSDEKITNYQKKYDSVKADLFKLLVQSSIKNINTNRVLSEKKIKVKSNTSKNKFLAMVNKAKKYIKLGDIFQVVLSQRFEAKLTKKPLEIYKKLRSTNPSPFMFYFNFQDFQIIGASPEILVRLRDNKITVRPIAGTRPRGKNKKEDLFYKKDLLNDKKELSEHLMLLDLGRNDAGKVSKINTVKVTESFIIEKYSHVMHIVSNVIGEYNKKFSKFKSLLAGFPAGTVSGAPKIRAMEIIDELETTKRKVYAGGIGYFSANGEFDTCIALRTAIAKNKKFYVQAGAGIVADSKPINEYNETVNKAKALINALR
ncbi:anthranilate synthase component I [Candidatus Pelagibacter sp. HIMB1321]|uniref:anthranilate synthase component I n=1 Tax=Candidatus Pelagibacter sp. HIMB1321 TaxID=1388755 RepID=UPI000A07DCD0|nr:anthranilate synthase component I [Candidatus Pelagibacter sp. HIMB1321]SMF74824.1 anthranilate synthase, component I [Candidatus Pelagibacter sp. HIMB1321]